jgi:hypothetical protein
LRAWIFSEREREVLKRWLNKRERKEPDFKVLKHLILKNAPQLHRDYELLDRALKSFAE